MSCSPTSYAPVPHVEALPSPSSWGRENYDRVAELAAFYVREALGTAKVDIVQLRKAPGSAEAEWSLRAHRWRWRFRAVRRLALLTLVAICFLELPRWCSQLPLGVDYKDGTFYMYPFNYMDCPKVLLVQAVATLVLAVDVYLRSCALGRSAFLASPVHLLQCCLLAGLLLDALLAVVCLVPCGCKRFSGLLRIPLVLTFDAVVTGELESLWHSKFEFLQIAGHLVAFMLGSAWTGTLLFQGQDGEGSWFRDFGTSWWSLQVLFTTNNFPDVMIAAYSHNRAYGVFFVGYISFGLFLLLQMVMAVVYSGYIRSRQFLVERSVQAGQDLLEEAFRVLDQEERGYLEAEQVFALFDALSLAGGFLLHGDERQRLLFAVLDSHGTGVVERGEFAHLARLLYLKFEPLMPPWLEMQAPGCWQAFHLGVLKDIVAGEKFELFVDVVLCISVAFTMLQTLKSLQGERHVSMLGWDHVVDLSFTLFFCAEMGVKGVLLAGTQYWKKPLNQLDALTTLGAVGAAATVVMPNTHCNYELVNVATIFRFCRVLRLFGKTSTFRVICKAIASTRHGVRRVAPLMAFMAIQFSYIGCELFGGMITTNPNMPAATRLASTDFAKGGYFTLNFNDRASGLMVLFGALVGNNWDCYVAAFGAVAGDEVARPFFLAWYCIGTLLGLNLLTSVVLDAFVSRWGKIQAGQEHEINPQVIFQPQQITGTKTGLTQEWAVSSCRTHSMSRYEQFEPTSRSDLLAVVNTEPNPGGPQGDTII